MTTLLRVDASVRLNGSVSRALADSAQAAWQAEHPDGVVIRRDLGRNPLPATAWPAIARMAVGEQPATDTERDQLAEALALVDEISSEVKNADAILLAVPLYNYGIPQHVKVWIDLLLTDEPYLRGVNPLIGRPIIFTLARGGGYQPGTPKHGWDHSTPYLERIFGDVLGMKIRKAEAELTLAPVTPAMADLIELSKVSESEAHVAAEEHGVGVAKELVANAA
ncbi:NAD(P)H-dependent oxidoreductase [Kribbella sp. NBC_01505]|uniref:FMN-dependent NADH-azoreductase n=1 Tax=Kribbella sp. NBC_01505 TaxID=2903580 RepID=UPI0038651291